jgi:hypothetical protein
MTTIDPGQPEPHIIGDEATTAAPRIVNGLTVRPREKVKLWHFGVCLLPDFVLFPAIIGLGLHRLLRYLDANMKRRAP